MAGHQENTVNGMTLLSSAVVCIASYRWFTTDTLYSDSQAWGFWELKKSIQQMKPWSDKHRLYLTARNVMMLIAGV